MSSAEQFPTVHELENVALASVPGGDFGGDEWREGLAVLLRAVAEEAIPSPFGVSSLRSNALRFLINRLEINQWYRDHPEIENEVIDFPVFSIGMVRTGTTALSFLLDKDPANRSLLHWFAMRPCPPPEISHFQDDPRIDAADRHLGTVGRAAEQKALIELLPEGPAECLYLLGLNFRSGHWEGMYRIPSYHDWLFTADMRSAYAWHKRALKLLQWRAPTPRWMLKYPSHTTAIPAILDAYPNARFIATHRDPVKSVTSVCSLVHKGAGTKWADPDLFHVGHQWTKIVEEQLRRMIEFRNQHGDGRFIDIHNDELVRQPMRTLERIYDWMGVEITQEARAGFEARIASSPKGAHGAHLYDPKTFGLDVDELAERFRFYTERFDICREG